MDVTEKRHHDDLAASVSEGRALEALGRAFENRLNAFAHMGRAVATTGVARAGHLSAYRSFRLAETNQVWAAAAYMNEANQYLGIENAPSETSYAQMLTQ